MEGFEMAVARVAGKMTATEYFLLPDDGKRYELIEGDLCQVTGPNRKHQDISAVLNDILRAEARKIAARVYYAPLDVYLSEYTVLQPDLLVVTKERSERLSDRGVEGAPDLVVEIMSPSTSERDKTLKSRLYAQAGVREYWLVSPEAGTIEVLVLGEEGYSVHVRAGRDETVSSTVLPELSFPASAIFDG